MCFCVILCVSVCLCVFLCVSVCQSLPYTYYTYAMLCTMHVFSAFIWPFHCIHIAVTKGPVACRRPKSFLHMMRRWIMAPGFQPKERLANRLKDQHHEDRQRHWFPTYATDRQRQRHRSGTPDVTSANRRNNAAFVTVACSVSTRWVSTAFSFGSAHAEELLLGLSD